MNLPYTMRMYWTHFWQPTVHVQLNIFEKTLTEVVSSHIYASSGTFCDQIFEAQWDFKLSEEFEIDVIFLRKQRFCRFRTFFKDSLKLRSSISASNRLLRATVSQNSSSVQMAAACHVSAAVLVHVARSGRLDADIYERSLCLQNLDDFLSENLHFY